MSGFAARINRLFSAIALVALFVSNVPAAVPVQAAASQPNVNPAPMDPKSIQYGSNWESSPIPADPKVPLLSEQLATSSEPQDILERAQVHLSIEPEIYIPGEPLQLSWKMKGVKKETGKVRLLFRFPEGVNIVNSSYAEKMTADRTLSLLVDDDKSGSFTLKVDSKATFPFYINAEVQVEGDKKVMNGDSVYVNSTGIEAKKGYTNKISPKCH